ncbi:MAG TPA: MarR family winged helix-turn-helix transcriptional regulator [Pseudonocardiaceae bacterium]|jgi:DNA-binding MarR family transcriptional regulator|nr:MarR family winged helix-turn-helix transcriptional regulator [Pseudonocardiaceae bacterium]
MEELDPWDVANTDLVDDTFFAWMATWRAQSMITKSLEREMRERFALPITACEVLSTLGLMPDGRMRMNDLANWVFLSKSGISQLITQMAGTGLVERQGDPDNLRITYAAITDQGRTTLRRVTPVFFGAIKQHFGQHLSADEASTVLRVMNRVLEAGGLRREIPDFAEALDKLRESPQDD